MFISLKKLSFRTCRQTGEVRNLKLLGFLVAHTSLCRNDRSMIFTVLLNAPSSLLIELRLTGKFSSHNFSFPLS